MIKSKQFFVELYKEYSETVETFNKIEFKKIGNADNLFLQEKIVETFFYKNVNE